MNRMMFFGFEISTEALRATLLSGPDCPTATPVAPAAATPTATSTATRVARIHSSYCL
jgi:hypothetical protein